jgi:hypothetical protein
MMRVYVIFAIVGWGWAVIVALFLAIYRPRRDEPRGFEATKRDES